MADLLFDWFGIDHTRKTFFLNQISKAVESKQNKHEVTCTVLLTLKLVLSGPEYAPIVGPEFLNVPL